MTGISSVICVPVRALLTGQVALACSAISMNSSGVTPSARPCTASVIDGTTMVFKDATGKIVFRAGGMVLAKPVGASILVLGTKRYRGAFRLTPASNRFSVINVVDLEKYLPGVVPLEMPASWAPQALRAQVIAARSYAMATDSEQEQESLLVLQFQVQFWLMETAMMQLLLSTHLQLKFATC